MGGIACLGSDFRMVLFQLVNHYKSTKSGFPATEQYPKKNSRFLSKTAVL